VIVLAYTAEEERRKMEKTSIDGKRISAAELKTEGTGIHGGVFRGFYVLSLSRQY
jgi:hypothetical protein